MLDSGRRPMGGLFYWALAIVVASGLWDSGGGIAAEWSRHGDRRRYGLPGGWDACEQKRDHYAAGVCVGERSGGGGGRDQRGVASKRSTERGPGSERRSDAGGSVYYTVVYQFGPGQVKTEYWVVPATFPANLATVRTTLGSGLAGQPVPIRYVNSELATKADDSAVVHLSGLRRSAGRRHLRVLRVCRRRRTLLI